MRTFLHTHAHTHTGMHATKWRVEHMEYRLFIHCNYFLQTVNGKTGFEHLTSDKEMNALPTLTSWMSTRNGLINKAIWQMHHAYVSIRYMSWKRWSRGWRKGKRRSTWVHSLTILKLLSCLIFIWKEFSQTTSFSPAHYLHKCVKATSINLCVSTWCLHTSPCPHRVVHFLGSNHNSHLDTVIKFDRTSFFWSDVPRVIVCRWVLLLSTILTIQLPYGTIW